MLHLVKILAIACRENVYAERSFLSIGEIGENFDANKTYLIGSINPANDKVILIESYVNGFHWKYNEIKKANELIIDVQRKILSTGVCYVWDELEMGVDLYNLFHHKDYFITDRCFVLECTKKENPIPEWKAKRRELEEKRRQIEEEQVKLDQRRQEYEKELKKFFIR